MILKTAFTGFIWIIAILAYYAFFCVDMIVFYSVKHYKQLLIFTLILTALYFALRGF